MSEETRVPVKLADCKVGDWVIRRYRGGTIATPRVNHRLVQVEKRLPKTIVAAGVRYSPADGSALGLDGQAFCLLDPTPAALALLAETAAKDAAREAQVAAEKAQRKAEEEAAARKAAEWVAGKTAAELLAFLPVYALRELWETIEPRLETADAVP